MLKIVAIIATSSVAAAAGNSTAPNTIYQDYDNNDANLICAGSPAETHQWCHTETQIKASCAVAKKEIEARIKGVNGWTDPKSRPGTYKLTTSTTTGTTGTRTSGDGNNYKDKMVFNYIDNGDGTCLINSCSDSQCESNNDQSTNYCNMRNLYCGSADGCKIVETDLVYQELHNNNKCPRKDPTKCFR